PSRRALQRHVVRRRPPRRHRARRLPGPAARRHLGLGPLPPQRVGSHPARPAQVIDPAQSLLSSPLDRLRALRHTASRLEVPRADRRRACRHEALCPHGPLPLRHVPLRPGQPRPHLRRQAVRRSEDGLDRVPENAISRWIVHLGLHRPRELGRSLSTSCLKSTTWIFSLPRYDASLESAVITRQVESAASRIPRSVSPKSAKTPITSANALK